MNQIAFKTWFQEKGTVIARLAWWSFLILFLMKTMTTQAAVLTTSQNSIRALDVTANTNGWLIIKVTLEKPLATPPAGVLLNNPPRLYFDLDHVTSTVDKAGDESNQGVLRSIDIAQTESRTRLVMNLLKVVSHETKVDNNQLLISLKEGASSNHRAGQPVNLDPAVTQQRDNRLSLLDIDFRRGMHGEGRVEVELSQPGGVVDVSSRGGKLFVEFTKAYLPPHLERRLDVKDFATPINIVDTAAKEGSVWMTIEPQGRWQHSAYQSGTQFVLEVRPAGEDEEIPIREKLVSGGYTGEKLSLNFQNVEVRSVLQVIADFTDLNIIASDSVKGQMTLRLKDVPWDQALDIVLQSNDLDKRRVGNVIFVAPREEMAAREKLQLEQRQKISDLEVLHTEKFKLNYRTASSIPLKGIMSQRGTVEIDDISNTLTVTDIPVRLAEVARHISDLDTQVRQVMIETRIVEAVDTFSRNLGARFGVQNATRIGNRNLGSSGNLNNSSDLAAGVPPSGGQNLNVNLPAAAMSGVAGGPAALGLSLIKINNGSLINLELSALESDSKGRIIASPRLVTANRVEASIEQGTEIPFQIVSVTQPQIQFKKAVLGLKVTPQITPDDNIIMKLQVNQDTRGEATPAGPAIDTKQIITEVLVENGGTVVIGGIFEQVEREDRNRVPLLSDIPILGNLFRNSARRDDKRELLIFVTPRILNENLGGSIRSALNY